MVFLYLLNGENVCGPGPLGGDSSGVERLPAVACTPPPDADFDVDAKPDLSDNCAQWPNPAQQDTDNDFVGNTCDNCSSVANSRQEDCNRDGEGDACDADSDCDADGVADGDDCAPLWGSLGDLPDPIGPTLRMEQGDQTRLHWLRSFQGYTANLYSGSLTIGHSWAYDLECEATELPGTEIVGEFTVPPGRLKYFLVSARNACGESEAGHGSSGAPVPVAEICPVEAADGDTDGIEDLADNCASVSNSAQGDADGDFVGDACDNCGNTFNPDQADGDDNGIGDACEPS